MGKPKLKFKSRICCKLGELLRETLEQEGLTAEQGAAKCCYTPKKFSYLEKGLRRQWMKEQVGSVIGIFESFDREIGFCAEKPQEHLEQKQE